MSEYTPLRPKERSKKMRELVDETGTTGEEGVDFEPTDMPDEVLDKLFDRTGHRNFITYVCGSKRERKELRVRVNCKYSPKDTRITFPLAMAEYRKTTMAKWSDDDHW